MRNDYGGNWAIGVRGALENIVRQNYPSHLRQWPIIQSFSFEAYQVGGSHCVLVLKDEVSEVVRGPGKLQPYPHQDHPPLPPTPDNLAEWLYHLINSFSLRGEDMAMVLPIHDSGKGGAGDDFGLFSEGERFLWDLQLQYWIGRHKAVLKIPEKESPGHPVNVTYNLYGPNSRVNISSTDASSNVVNETPPELFDKLLSVVKEAAAEPDVVSKMSQAVEDMQREYGTPSFVERYQKFMAVFADHIQVFGPVVGPFLPALSRLIGSAIGSTG